MNGSPDLRRITAFIRAPLCETKWINSSSDLHPQQHPANTMEPDPTLEWVTADQRGCRLDLKIQMVCPPTPSLKTAFSKGLLALSSSSKLLIHCVFGMHGNVGSLSGDIRTNSC